jgi:hypothetical protein
MKSRTEETWVCHNCKFECTVPFGQRHVCTCCKYESLPLKIRPNAVRRYARIYIQKMAATIEERTKNNQAANIERENLLALTALLRCYDQAHPPDGFSELCLGCRYPGDSHRAECSLLSKGVVTA